MLGDKTTIITTIKAFITHIQDDTDVLIISKSLNIDCKRCKITRNKRLHIEDGVILSINTIIDMNTYNIEFTGDNGKIIFLKGYKFNRTSGSIMMNVHDVHFDISITEYNSFTLMNSDSWNSNVSCYFSGEIERNIDVYGCELKYPKPIFNIDCMKSTSDIAICSNINIVLYNKDTLGCIFYIRGNGNISFGKNITVSSCEDKCNVNYGLYIDRGRYNDREINIHNTDLGERSITYNKQYVIWLDIFSDCFRSDRDLSYVAVSVIDTSLCNVRSTKNNIKHSEIRSVPINMCFGRSPISDVKLKTNIKVNHNEYFHEDDINSLIENNNLYFGCFNISNDRRTEYTYNLSQIGMRNINTLYEFIPIESYIVGDTECEIIFDNIKSDEYVLPKSIKYTITEGDVQDMNVKCYNDTSYSLTEYNLDKHIDRQLKITLSYKPLLPVNMSIKTDNWNSLKLMYDDEYKDLDKFHHTIDKVEDTFTIRLNSDEYHLSGIIYVEFILRNIDKKMMNSFSNKIHIEDDDDSVKISKDNILWIRGMKDNRIFLMNIKGIVHFDKSLSSSILYSDVDFYMSSVSERYVKFNIHSITSKFNIVLYNNSKERDMNYNSQDEDNKSVKIHNITKIYARVFYNGDYKHPMMSKRETKTFYIDIYDDEYCCKTYCTYITDEEIFIRYRDRWSRGRDIDITTTLDIMIDDKREKELEFHTPYISDTSLSYNMISKSHSKHPDIELPKIIISDSNTTVLKFNLSSNSVYGERYYDLISDSELLSPKIHFDIKETNSRGIEVYIDNKKCLDVDASDNLYVSDYDVITYNPSKAIKSYPYSRESYIESYIILKSMPLDNCIFTISASSECLRRKIKNKYTSLTSSVDFIFTEHNYNNSSSHKFYIDIQKVDSSSPKLTFTLKSPYVFNDSDCDYRTLEIKEHSFHIFEFHNIIDTHTETTYINLGMYMITTDNEGRLVIKQRSKISSNHDDFITTKILDTYK